MTDPGTLSIKDYTYTLPENRIAGYPAPEREASRLLVYKDGDIISDRYKNIADHIPSDSLMVFNNTKVVEARLLFQKPTGGLIEIFCLEPHEQYPDITRAMLQQEKVWWRCLVGGASKWKHGQVLEKKISRNGNETFLKATFVEKKTDSFVIELAWKPSSLHFAEVLHRAGIIPLPPYIKRASEEEDKERYQTVYARAGGSVAAPTAGLHFTENIFAHLQDKNIKTDFLTLHVGAGTFKPVKTEKMRQHEMHAEWIDVSRNNLQNILENIDKNILAVGTTSLRTIESLYWLGRKTELLSSSHFPEQDSCIRLDQWEAYELAKENIPAKEALQSLLAYMEKNKWERLVTKTQILIAPGYEFKIINGLITNFHQPQSTLLLLVAALIGEDWEKVYHYALQNDFRFLSYGDGSLLWKKNS